ncbi:MAG: MBL fold metallo-hydrolase [Euryarchaeota archaeon]|nr:MBL fold metallo-hydrolase [Euryarchaeota archaeon]
MAVYNLTEEADTFTCNVFLVVGEQTTLIDAGAMPGIVESIRKHTDDLDRVVLTHQHGDHVDQLDRVVEAFGPDVYAYADHPHRTHELASGDRIEIGDEECEAIHSPGHADDHLAFVSGTTIYGGDVVVHDDGAFEGGSFGRTDMAGQSREELIESVRRILDRLPEGVEHMYSGHGGEFHGDVREVIETALERAERREPKYPE